MKLRVRVNKQTSRVELAGEEPTLTELNIQIKEILLPSHGLSPDADFTLSLNGAEPLADTGQTLSSCGIVSGDLICVILPPSAAVAAPAPMSQVACSSQAACSSKATPRREETPPSPAGGLVSEAEPNKEVALEREQEVEVAPLSWEPMLCDEAAGGQVPLSLDVLYQDARSCSRADAVMVVVHLLMMETGFLPQPETGSLPQGSEVRSGKMPSGWRRDGGVYRLEYFHPLCEDSLTVVVAIQMGEVLAVNACMKMNEQMVDKVSRLTLKPALYATGVSEGEGSAVNTYKDLRKLSRVFKDKLAYPVIAATREAMALPPVFGLSALPPELLLRVLRLLDVGSLVALSSVSRHLHGATADSTLWRHLYRRYFRDCQDSHRSADWKELFKQKYKWQRKGSRAMPHRLPFPFSPSPPGAFHPVPTPLYPPGIIGGEYDQRPGVPYGILPRPRYDPIGPLPGYDPTGGGGSLTGRRGLRPSGNRPADVRRGFI